MTIRSATLHDVPALHALMVQSMAALGTAFYASDRAEAAARYLTVPDDDLIEDETLYVAEIDGRLAGVGGWSSRRKLFTGSTDQEALTGRLDPQTEPARIRAFFVAPDFARRGVAKALYDRCEVDARAAGFRSFVLMATLPGVPLYRALGFGEERPISIILPDSSGLDCVEMKKSLS